MKTICELFAQYPTDKNTYHSYGPVYEELLAPMRESTEVVIEVGIMAGASLRAWRDYFENATVYGIDNRAETLFSEDRIVCVQADERLPGELQEKVAQIIKPGQADFIVDDGSHDAIDQLMMLFTLWPFLRLGGLYVIEDSNDPAGPLSKTPQVKTYDLRKPGRTHDDIMHVYHKVR